MYGDITAIPTLSGRLTIPTSSSAVLIDKTITDNGVYHAIDDNADGYKDVTVALPLGTKAISANGSYNASSDELKGYSSVSVNVQPTLGEKTITTNGTFYASDDNVQGYSKIITEVHGQGVKVVTQSEYDALSEEEKLNGTIYQISAVSELINMTGATEHKEFSMTITSGNGTVSFSRDTGARIGCNICRSLDVTNIEAIEYNLTTGTFYGDGNCNNDGRALYIGVGGFSASNNFTWYTTSPLLFNSHMLANKKYLRERIDVSDLTGVVYFNIQGNGVIMDMTQITAYSNLNKLMYMGNEYIKE